MTDLLHSLTIGDVARENRRRFPGRTAVVCGETRMDFVEFDQRTTSVAAGLKAAGVGRGDRVLWLGQNCHRVLELLVACSKIGAVFCPANWRQSASELAFVIEDSAPRLIIAQRLEVGPVIAEARAKVRDGVRWIFHDDDGPEGYEAVLAQHQVDDDEDPIADHEPVLMIYTAAFDGRPSGATSGSTSLIGQGLITALAESLTFDDVFLASGPLFHVGCWRYVAAMIVLGGTTVMARRVDAEELCRLIAAERCSHAYLLPPTQEQMVEVNRDGRYDLASLRAVRGSDAWEAMVSAQPTPWSDRPQRYGQTEAGGIVAFGAFGPAAAGGHGRANPLSQLRILDEGGQELGVGESGEIAVRGPLVMNGYHQRPDLNNKKFVGGWLLTRDLGRREADGSITFLGPKSRMLKCGLENVYPVEVEQALLTLDGILQCGVIGVPDDRFTQVVKAVVVLTNEAHLTAPEIIDHARGRLARYKVPKQIEIVEELPRIGGTIDYAALDARFGGGNYPGDTPSTGR